jgi:hypothetical protein
MRPIGRQTLHSLGWRCHADGFDQVGPGAQVRGQLIEEVERFDADGSLETRRLEARVALVDDERGGAGSRCVDLHLAAIGAPPLRIIAERPGRAPLVERPVAAR